jgi:hypothetical protein
VSLPLHLVWLGGAVPLRGLENLHRLARMHEQALSEQAEPQPQDRPYFPLLWLDRSAWDQTLAAQVTPLEPVPGAAVPAAIRTALADGLDAHVAAVRWLRLDAAPQAAAQTVFLPVLLYEEMRHALAEPWRRTDLARERLRSMARTPAGQAFLAGQARLGDMIEAAGADGAGPQFAAYLGVFIDHVRSAWARHGLLCLASDLLRLQALVWRPGAYADIGDAAGLLQVLPTLRRVRAAESVFSAHCTVAIENDLVFCAERALMQAVTLGALIWSLRTLQATAARLGLPDPGRPPDLARAVLPALDRRMPATPDLRPLYETPHAGLANYVNRAYGSHHLVGDPAALDPYFSGRQTKEMMIDHVGGFTGYQLFANVLAPACRQVWKSCQVEFGLLDYAPQLGWKTHGFGTLERLVGHGQRLRQGHPRLAGVRRELRAMSTALGLPAPAMEPLALRVSEVHDLLRQAHFEPARRDALVARALARCAQP